MIIDQNDASSHIARGTGVPRPPRKGEILICQMCGQKLLPEHFSKNPAARKREFKWQIHPECFAFMNDQCDRAVPGLLAERKKAEERATRN